MSNNKENKQKKIKKQYPAHGQAHICATFQNTIITITDVKGDTLCSSSVGQHGYSNSRKKQAFGAGLAAEAAAKKAQSFGMNSVDVFLQGAGAGRDNAIRSLAAAGLRVKSLIEKTGQPFNGCRPKKVKRN